MRVLFCLFALLYSVSAAADKTTEIYLSLLSTSTTLDVDSDLVSFAPMPRTQAFGVGIGFKALTPNRRYRISGDFVLQRSSHDGEYPGGVPVSSRYTKLDMGVKMFFRPLSKIQPFLGIGAGSTWVSSNPQGGLYFNEKLSGQHIYINGGTSVYLSKDIHMGLEALLNASLLVDEFGYDLYTSADLHYRFYLNYTFSRN